MSDKLPGASVYKGKASFVTWKALQKEEVREETTASALRRKTERHEKFWQTVTKGQDKPKATREKKRGGRLCSLCHEPGHYAPRCSNKCEYEDYDSDDESRDSEYESSNEDSEPYNKLARKSS